MAYIGFRFAVSCFDCKNMKMLILSLALQLKQRYHKHVFPPASTVKIMTVLAVQNGGL